MFSGTTYPKLDDKGRLIIPAKFRELLDGPIYVTKTQEYGLAIYTAEEFRALAEQLSKARSTTVSARSFVRMIISSAELQVPDKQGRISIPLHLREYAKLNRDLAVVGNINKVEIFDAEVWNKMMADQDDLFANRDEEVIPGVF